MNKHISKAFRLIGYYSRQHFFASDLRNSRRDKIVFIVPNDDIINGGVMSIVNMYNTARRFFPEKDVCLAVVSRYQSFSRYSKVECDAEIINIRYFLRVWLRHGDRILFHVFEGGCNAFFDMLKEMNLLKDMKGCILNILNQNQELMPDEKLLTEYAPYFDQVSMTLAFKENEALVYPYLTISPMHVGAIFEGAVAEPVPFAKKEDLCVISADPHPDKELIKLMLREEGIEVFDDYPIPYPQFVKLQQRAKWTVSFGEGLDGYTGGEFRNGGIGFGVFQPNFTHDYIDAENLPPFLFRSYEEMKEKLIPTLRSFNQEDVFDKVSADMRNKILSDPATNTPDKVAARWKSYYKKINWL